MITNFENLVKKAYSAFNLRDIVTALSAFHPEVLWPKAFEGGYISGHNEVRKYWSRQWAEINPKVEPIEFQQITKEIFEVKVHQLVKDLDDNILFDGIVKHIYTLEDNLLKKMDIEIE